MGPWCIGCKNRILDHKAVIQIPQYLHEPPIWLCLFFPRVDKYEGIQAIATVAHNEARRYPNYVRPKRNTIQIGRSLSGLVLFRHATQATPTHLANPTQLKFAPPPSRRYTKHNFPFLAIYQRRRIQSYQRQKKPLFMVSLKRTYPVADNSSGTGLKRRAKRLS